MTLEELIYSTLTGDATLAPLVGTRVFPDYDRSPEDPNAAVSTFIVFGLESEEEVESLYEERVWFASQYAIACVSDSADTKVTMANAVKAALKATRGSHTGLVVKQATLSNVRDEPSEDLRAANLHMRTVYYEFKHAAA